MTTDIFLQLLDDTFVDVRYELVVLHPEHLLQKWSDTTVYTHANGQLSGKRYVVGQDRMLYVNGPELWTVPVFQPLHLTSPVGERCHYMYSWSC